MVVKKAMGLAIVLTAAVFEIAIVIARFTAKSDLLRLRSYVRITAFSLFILLTLLAVFEWGPRYFALAAVLFILAVISIIRLLRHRKMPRAFKPARTVLSAAGIIALVFVAAAPVILFPPHAPIGTTGPLAVSTATYMYTDTDRMETYTDNDDNRTLTAEFWYPATTENTGAYPLIVFSHGSFGIRTSNESLYNELASHGYVVCSIDHTYQCLYTTGVDGHRVFADSGYVKELQVENAKTDPMQSFLYYQKWMAIRTGDIDFVIDTILNQASNANADTAYKLVDSSKIGVIGHSLGGSAVLGMGRLREEDIDAVIALEAPFMCDIQGVENSAFVWNDTPYPVPVLNIYSDSSWDHLDQWPQYAENARLLTDDDPDSFNVHISGAGHLSLTDLSLTSPFLTTVLNGEKARLDNRECLGMINALCLEFFDAYLKGTGTFAI